MRYFVIYVKYEVNYDPYGYIFELSKEFVIKNKLQGTFNIKELKDSTDPGVSLILERPCGYIGQDLYSNLEWHLIKLTNSNPFFVQKQKGPLYQI